MLQDQDEELFSLYAVLLQFSYYLKGVFPNIQYSHFNISILCMFKRDIKKVYFRLCFSRNIIYRYDTNIYLPQTLIF